MKSDIKKYGCDLSNKHLTFSVHKLNGNSCVKGGYQIEGYGFHAIA